MRLDVGLRCALLVSAACAACGGPLPSAPEPALPPSEPSSLTLTPPSLPSLTPPLAADAERSEEDRALDPPRHPVEMLAFFGIGPGQRVAELGAGTGYTTELLARAVGPTGVVYGENPKWLLQRSAEKPWAERLAKPVMKNVTRLDREFDDPFPADLTGLDAVISVLFYHDTVWLGTDRDRMNRAAFAALRPGGVYGIVDMSGPPNSGTRDVKTFHRIDEAFVKAEVEKAGFKLAGEADFLRNPGDPRDWNDTPGARAPAPAADEKKRGTSDRFVLKFVKPTTGG